jgi:hypothetical protein
MIKKKDITVTSEKKFQEDEIIVRAFLHLAQNRVLTDDSLRTSQESKRLVYLAHVECKQELFDKLYGEFKGPIKKIERNIDLLKKYLVDNCHPLDKMSIERIEEAAGELRDLIK